MVEKWIVNRAVLKKAKELGRCCCDIGKTCLCDDFLERGECICGAFKEVKENE